MAITEVKKLSLALEFSGEDTGKYTCSSLKTDADNEQLMSFGESVAKLFPTEMLSVVKSIEEHILED